MRMSEAVRNKADEYLDKFLDSDLNLIKISDEQYSDRALKEALNAKIKERDIRNVITYVFINGLYLEKI